MRKIQICILVIALSCSIVSGCGKAKSVEKKEEAIPVKVMRVKEEGLSKLIEYIGNVKGENEVSVYPKVSGKIIEKVMDEGSFIHKGEPIAYIDRDEVGLKFEKAPVESPINGIVGRVYVDIGSSVTPQTPVALVSDLTNVEIGVDVPEKYLPLLALNQDAEVGVDAYPDRKFTGTVKKISPIVDIQTRTAPVEILIDNTEGLLQSGMYAKIKINLENSARFPVILKESIIGRDSNSYVFIVENNKAVLRKVALGMRQGPYYAVREGLKEGDMVVIMGQQRLGDGSAVVVEE